MEKLTENVNRIKTLQVNMMIFRFIFLFTILEMLAVGPYSSTNKYCMVWHALTCSMSLSLCLSLFLAAPLQSLGCDEYLGSGKVMDRCGVCGGDNTACKVVTGLFQHSLSKVGYHKVVEIPEGATKINVTEMMKSRNYLGKCHVFIRGELPLMLFLLHRLQGDRYTGFLLMAGSKTHTRTISGISCSHMLYYVLLHLHPQ